MTDLTRLEHFFVKQRITMMVNRYEIRAANADGGEGELIAFAQQKRMAFKEEVPFYADEARDQLLFAFKARSRLDLAATYDVRDADGNDLGWFRKDFSKSLLRSTWHLGTAGVEAVGQERSLGVALGRRAWDLLPIDLPSPFRFHFDFVDAQGQVVLTSLRQRSLRDRYDVTVPGARVDGRVAAAMAVALDALQSR